MRDISVVVVVFAVFYFFAVYPHRHLSSNPRYTIATVKDIVGTLNGDPDANIIYYVGGREYKGFMSSYKGNGIFYKKGERVFIKYYPLDPNESVIIPDKYVSDKLAIPPNGWDTLPY